MKQHTTFNKLFISIIFFVVLFFGNCSSPGKVSPQTTDSVAANIKMYSHVWDEIINKRRLELFNDSNFTKDVIMHANPDIVGIDSARAYYANYLTGFSDITFTIKDVFGQGDKLVKHWNFKGTHTGVFFGIPATGKKVDIDGVTLVRMQDGRIAEERDFVDNLDLMTQLGQLPAATK
ncbi:MAG: ester cyclase [Chitinophagales bacterium]